MSTSDENPIPHSREGAIRELQQVLADAGFYHGNIDGDPFTATRDAAKALMDAHQATDAAVNELLEDLLAERKGRQEGADGELAQLATQRDEILAEKLALEIELEATRTALDACRESRPADLEKVDAAVGKIIRNAFQAIVAAEREAADEDDSSSPSSD